MSKHVTRVIILFIALLFLVTAMVPLLQVWQEQSSKKAAKQQEAALNEQANKPKLQGTKLTNFTPVASIPELQKVDTVAGKGPAVKAGATVTVDYTGAVAATGVIFQSSKDFGQPASLKLSEVIAGWSQGIPGMQVGGTRRLLIPAALAYGPSPPPGSGIPANADLVFDVTLRSVSK